MHTRLLSLVFVSALLGSVSTAAEPKPPYFGIQIVDEQTGRGVPLVEMRTVNNVRFITDNAGWIAFNEPGLMGREVWFYFSHCPGYERQKDGFGMVGARLKTAAGESATVKLKRTNIAERLGRVTGQGLYRDSELLGFPCPLPNMNNGGVMGQDSVQAVPWKGKVFWLWGDTNIPQYPLGNFRTTAALTPRNVDPEKGIALEYFMDSAKPAELRKMMPFEEPGAVWLFGLFTLNDESGQEKLLSHWGRYKGLTNAEAQGIAQFNEEKGVFENVKSIDPTEKWRHPRNHAVRVKDDSGDWIAFTFPFFHTRVPASAKAVIDPAQYEALWFDPSAKEWKWQKEKPPTTPDEEDEFLKDGAMKPEQARFHATDAEGKYIKFHRGSIQWNEWRKRWVFIGTQFGGRDAASHLGEIWYAEAQSPWGPWTKAVKVASHPRYSYYNPIHHGWMDKEGGKIIHFEGTYTLEFSGNPYAPERYDYNQILYRLDLGDPRLTSAQK